MAKKLADDIDVEAESVRTHVAAMRNATAAADVTGWSTSKKVADEGVKQLKYLAKVATATSKDAIDPAVRDRLTAARQAHEAASHLVAEAPAAPKARPPPLTCADALLAVLPPDPPPPTWIEADFKTAEHAVAKVFASHMTSSDIAAFRAMVNGEHDDHEIARRFHRFGDARRKQLLLFLGTADVKGPAHTREVAQRGTTRNGALLA